MKAIVNLSWGRTQFEVPFKDLELFLKIVRGNAVNRQWTGDDSRYYKETQDDSVRVDIIETIHPRALSDDEIEAIKEAKRLAKKQEEAATT
jgi:hypothetical protein